MLNHITQNDYEKLFYPFFFSSIPLTVTYTEYLPKDIPPSYKGQDIKILYKVCIGIGRIGRPLAMVRLPFRVMELKGKINWKELFL